MFNIINRFLQENRGSERVTNIAEEQENTGDTQSASEQTETTSEDLVLQESDSNLANTSNDETKALHNNDNTSTQNDDRPISEGGPETDNTISDEQPLTEPITSQLTESDQPMIDQQSSTEPITTQLAEADQPISDDTELELGTRSKVATSTLLSKIRDESANETSCQSIASDENSNPLTPTEETITNISEPYEVTAYNNSVTQSSTADEVGSADDLTE